MIVGRRKDTVIGICSAEDYAVIYTTDRFYINLFERLQELYPERIRTVCENVINGEVSEKTYEMQKTMIWFEPGSAKDINGERRKRYKERFLQEVQEAKEQGFIGSLEGAESENTNPLDEERLEVEEP